MIVGDNASGKSELLRMYVQRRIREGGQVYYIDAVNRYFQVSKVNDSIRQISFSDKITKARIEDENFNLTDTWAYFGTATESIELIYPLFEEQLQNLLQEFFGVRFSILLKEANEVVYDFHETGKLSSGYQAVVRLFLELLYYQRTKTEQEAVVVIDELDEYLSPGTAVRLYPFLREHFPELSYLCSTHSAEILSGARDCNILILSADGVEILDSNDFEGMDEIASVFRKIFHTNESGERTELDEKLRLLLNNRMSGRWGEQEEQMFASIDETQLSKARRMIYREIKEW